MPIPNLSDKKSLYLSARHTNSSDEKSGKTRYSLSRNPLNLSIVWRKNETVCPIFDRIGAGWYAGSLRRPGG
jgi:hypothetical protein